MDYNLFTKNLITENNNYEIKYLYSRPNGQVGIGRRVCVILSANKYGDKNVDLITNPIIIFELNDTDLEFIPERIFDNIQFEIGGILIDKIYSNQIIVLQKKYNLEVKKIGSKVFFPLPINCLIKSNGIPISKCVRHEFRLWFDLTDEPLISCINDLCVRTELVILEKQPVWKNICEPILSELINTSIYSDIMKKYIQEKPYENFESKQIIKFKQNQFTDAEKFNGFDSIKCLLKFKHDIERFYIWFVNSNDVIYKEKQFDKITFFADNINVLELNYEDLVYKTLFLNKNKGLGKGIYEIEWKNVINYVPESLIVVLNGTIPNQDISFKIYAESYNYLEFENNESRILFEN